MPMPRDSTHSRYTDPIVALCSRARPSHYWTVRLLEQGFSLSDCEDIRRLPRDQLLADLSEAVAEGSALAIETLLSREELEQGRQHVELGQETALAKLYRHVSGT